MRIKHSLQRQMMLFTVITMLVIGTILGGALYITMGISKSHEAETLMNGTAIAYASEIDKELVRVETSVNDIAALADNVIQTTDQVTDQATRLELTDQIREIFLAIMEDSEYGVANYMIYDPDLIGYSDGIFYSKNNEGNLAYNRPTNIKAYSEDDLEHVGWFYEPKKAGKPIWMEPYYNRNIHKWLISYIVPFYKDDQLIAVIGLDLDFKKLVTHVDGYTYDENGFAFLINHDGSLHYHDAFFDGETHGDDILQVTAPSIYGRLAIDRFKDNLIRYAVDDQVYIGTSVELRNGMKLFLCDDYDEVFSDRASVLRSVVFFTIIITVLIILIFSRYIKKISDPLKKLKRAVFEIENGNYNAQIPKVGDNEIGVLAGAVRVMAQTLEKQKRLNESSLAEKNRQLEIAIKDADRANQAKSDFLSQMSHDIRTPMNAIVGMSVIARENTNNPEKLTDCLDKIGSSSKYLLSLINDVLDMSRIESGKLAFTEEEYSVQELLDKTVEVLGEQIKAHKHAVKMDLSNVEHDYIHADGLRLQQVFTNIISNSIKYTDDGGDIDIKVEETQKRRRTSHYRFTFKDNGIGMSEEFVSNIFTPFMREKDEHQTEVKGTGLGMAITKAIVDAMGGEISVSSVRGSGTCVTIDMDLDTLEKTKKTAQATDASDNGTGMDTLDLTGKRILIVDDIALNLEITQTILEMVGANTQTVLSGKEAVANVVNNPENYYDLIFMDIRMPIMDGYETTRAIRSCGKHYTESMPIIAMSADAFEEDKQKSREAGMNEHIAKPIDMKVLTEVLVKYLK